MFTKVKRPAFAVLGIFALSLSASVVHAQKPEAAEESPTKLAQQVYDGLLEEYRNDRVGGVTQLDLLNNWSVRIIQAQVSETLLGDGQSVAEVGQKSIRDHLARMQKLERIVELRYKADLVTRTDLHAARYFRLQVNGFAQLIEGMQQFLKPREIEGDFDIRMPTVGKAKPLTAEPLSIVIAINEKGKLFVKGKELTLDQLEKQIQKLAKDDPQSAVSIRVHPDCIYANVVRVLSVCGKSGLSISFTNVEVKPEEN
jgi:hypothetical protein